MDNSDKCLVISLFVAHRSMQLFLAIQIMISYNLWVLAATCLGQSAGNMMFGGLLQDQILISRVKRQIKMNKVLNQKVNEHNSKVKDFCLKGDKTLISSFGDPMSLQKI